MFLDGRDDGAAVGPVASWMRSKVAEKLPAACDKITLFLSRPSAPWRGAATGPWSTVETGRGLARELVACTFFFFTLRLPQASSTQRRRRRRIITGRCPQAAPDAPRATRAAAARRSTAAARRRI